MLAYTKRVRKGRLTFVVFVGILAAWYCLNGQWKMIVKLPSTLRSNIYTADYDAYAISLGTTTHKIEQDFYQRQVDLIRKARDAGQRECTWFSKGDCYRGPTWGRPAIRHDIGTDDIVEGTRRTLSKAGVLVSPIIGSLLVAIFLVYALPVVLRRFWLWLAPPS